ncbi:hypothetical protein [Flavobacterium panici]|uniref:Uncharacterized protein n=1 Tax=Flavobacterium panici TaxID=2654843 RepID=A0A9N8J5W6_9FLAO|nr:hypothetical protein [Flavobacterium panici]CAC9976794.1 hypothetical protein FLAPXU55_04522 [Flavobacterium panici]
MTYSVLTKVTNNVYNNQKFYLYKHGEEDSLNNFTKEEAEKLKQILDDFQNVFSETEIVPREDDEIKYIEISDNTKNLHFAFENVFDDCPGILQNLEEFDVMISGIDRDETVRQTFKD